jgi:AcrR family transcriptional regulator
MAAIAAEAGVDRRTVYRRFENREALLSAVYTAKLDATEAVLDAARLADAPVEVALHRYIEAIIPVSRRWPLDLRTMMKQDPVAERRANEQRARLGAFLQRAVDEGHVRRDLPAGWPMSLLGSMVDNAAHVFVDIEPGPAADLVMASFIRAVG